MPGNDSIVENATLKRKIKGTPPSQYSPESHPSGKLYMFDGSQLIYNCIEGHSVDGADYMIQSCKLDSTNIGRGKWHPNNLTCTGVGWKNYVSAFWREQRAHSFTLIKMHLVNFSIQRQYSRLMRDLALDGKIT